MCGDYYNKVPKFFDTSPSKGKNLCPSLSNLSSLTTSIIKYHRSDTRSVILGRLRPQKPAASSFCLLKCSLLEPSRHAVQRPRACAGVPAQNHHDMWLRVPPNDTSLSHPRGQVFPAEAPDMMEQKQTIPALPWPKSRLLWLGMICYTVVDDSEKALATHSSTFAWKLPRMEEPGGLQSTGLRRVGHDWATSLSLFTFMHWRRKWQPTPVSLPGESQVQGSLVGAQSRTRLKQLSSSSSNIPTYKGCVAFWCGEGNGIPLQYSCLENPMDGGAW